MHDDAYISGRSENNIKCAVHDDLGWKNRTTRYILPRHWLYEWFSQFHRCVTYSVLSRSHSIFSSKFVHNFWIIPLTDNADSHCWSDNFLAAVWLKTLQKANTQMVIYQQVACVGELIDSARTCYAAWGLIPQGPSLRITGAFRQRSVHVPAPSWLLNTFNMLRNWQEMMMST